MSNNKVDIELFPKNYSLIEIMSRKIEFTSCLHDIKSRDLICLDETCNSKTDFCKTCQQIFHFNCSTNLIIHKKTFGEIVQIDKIDVNVNNWKTYLNKEILSEIEDLKSRLLKFVGCAEKEIIKEQNRTSDITVDNFNKNFRGLSSVYDENLKCIRIFNKNKIQVEEFAKNVKRTLGIYFWNEIKKKENEQLLFSASKMLTFKDSIQVEFAKLSELVNKGNWFLKEHFWFAKIQNSEFRNLKEFYQNFQDCLAPKIIQFDSINFIGMTREEIDKSLTVINKAFNENINTPIIEDKISDGMDQIFGKKDGTWESRIFFGEYELPDHVGEKVLTCCFGNIWVQITFYRNRIS